MWKFGKKTSFHIRDKNKWKFRTKVILQQTEVFVEHTARTLPHRWKLVRIQAGSILSFRKLLQSPLKLHGIQKLRSNSSLLLMRHFTSVFSSWEKFSNWVKQMGSGYLKKKKKSNPTTPSCLDWWLICLEFSGQAFRFLITAISPPISNSLSLRLTQDMEIPVCDGRVPFMYFNKRINSYQLSGCPSEFSFSSKVRLFYIKKDAW